jgi:WD40 repeat protein
MISAGRDALITFWNNEERLTDYHQIPAHMYAINDLVISPNEKYFATCSIDKTIKIWDTKAMRLLKVIDKNRSAGHGTSVNKLFWINNNKLVSCSDDRTVSIWQLKQLL